MIYVVGLEMGWGYIVAIFISSFMALEG